MALGEQAACCEEASGSVYRVVVWTPRRLAVLLIRRAISPRFAIKREVIGVTGTEDVVLVLNSRREI